MDLLVLGKSPAAPDAGGAQSGYLISHDGFTLLLDCGSGVCAQLRAQLDLEALDAVLVSHLHADHTLDLLPLSFTLANPFLGEEPRRPPLWAPPGARSVFATFAGALGMQDQIAQGFELREYDPAAELRLGPFTIRFAEVPHYIPAWAVDLVTGSGTRFTFGADCGPNDQLVALARDTDLLLLEATEGPGPHSGSAFRGHLTASEAGELAHRAGARRLLLTHYSDQWNPTELRSAAEATYGMDVELATAGIRYEV